MKPGTAEKSPEVSAILSDRTTIPRLRYFDTNAQCRFGGRSRIAPYTFSLSGQTKSGLRGTLALCDALLASACASPGSRLRDPVPGEHGHQDGDPAARARPRLRAHAHHAERLVARREIRFV